MNKVETLKELATKINGAMERHRYSQSALADELGVTQQSLSNYISGKVIPNCAVLRLMCRILGLRYTEVGDMYVELRTLKMKKGK